MLESPKIVKIMHAASEDCKSVYRDKVKLWNLFDTNGNNLSSMSFYFQQFFHSCLQSPGVSKERKLNAPGKSNWFQQTVQSFSTARESNEGPFQEHSLEDGDDTEGQVWSELEWASEG